MTRSDAVSPVVIYDPGSFLPYYVDALCRHLAKLGVRAQVIASPPLFEPVDDGGVYDVEPLFFPILRGAVRAGGDKWRLLRSRIQGEELSHRDSLPTYGSLLVDAERILDELERAEDSLAVSTP